MSNFTLIGKKNGMMDIIRGDMNVKKKKRKEKAMGGNQKRPL